MSEDKRKNARLQGRFSNERERPGRREKEKHHDKKVCVGQDTPEDGENVNADTSGQKIAADGISVQYMEDSNISFKELTEKKKPEEIRGSGSRVLSTTLNGTSRIIYEPNFITQPEAEALYEVINSSTKWYDKNIVIHGKEVPQPRLVAWYGPFPYSYSGAVLAEADMPPVIQKIRNKVESYLKEHNLDVSLNSVLLNLYRNEKDSVAWHSDDELTMGVCPTIASVSLGESRKFEMKPKAHAVEEMKDVDPETVYFANLKHGSLIIMDGCMQKDWMHRVPKEYHSREPRINLTFRTVYPINDLPSEKSRKTTETSERLHSCKISQPEPVFDSENFPTLSSVGKRRSNSSDNHGAAPSVSPSMPPDRCENAENTSPSTDIEAEKDSINLLNESNVNEAIDYTACVDTTVPSCSEENNYNLLDSEKSKLPVGKHVPNDPQIPSDCGSTQKNFSHGRSDRHSGPKVSGPEDRNMTRSHIQNRSQLNANAPDFIPQQMSYQVKSQYSRLDLIALANMYQKNEIVKSDMYDFREALCGNLMRDRSLGFTSRDWYELEVLCKISDGNQTERNQALIYDRICSMIKHVADYKYEYRSPQRYPRTVHGSNNYGKPKSSYPANSRRY